jgi:hypothetical protein
MAPRDTRYPLALNNRIASGVGAIGAAQNLFMYILTTSTLDNLSDKLVIYVGFHDVLCVLTD